VGSKKRRPKKKNGGKIYGGLEKKPRQVEKRQENGGLKKTTASRKMAAQKTARSKYRHLSNYRGTLRLKSHGENKTVGSIKWQNQ